jgi:hypothetical protein
MRLHSFEEVLDVEQVKSRLSSAITWDAQFDVLVDVLIVVLLVVAVFEDLILLISVFL